MGSFRSTRTPPCKSFSALRMEASFTGSAMASRARDEEVVDSEKAELGLFNNPQLFRRSEEDTKGTTSFSFVGRHREVMTN